MTVTSYLVSMPRLTFRLFAMVMAIFLFAACQPRLAELKSDNAPPFVRHENDAQATSGRIGYLLGSLIGIPVSIICLPVTIPLNSGNKDPQSASSLLAPMHYCGTGLGTVTGILTWLLFGWYTFDEDASAPIKSRQ